MAVKNFFGDYMDYEEFIASAMHDWSFEVVTIFQNQPLWLVFG